jgi:SPW repeat
MFNAWIVGLAGIWMVIAPFVPMSLYGNAWNDWIVGVIVAVLGFSLPDHGWQRWLAGFVGLWLIASGFIPGLRLTGGMYTNDIVAGILLIIAGFSATRPHHVVAMPPPHGAH